MIIAQFEPLSIRFTR